MINLRIHQQAILDELSFIAPGTLILFSRNGEASGERLSKFHMIAMHLGMRVYPEVVATREGGLLDGVVAIRRVSVFDTTAAAYALLEIDKVVDDRDAGEFLHRAMFDIMQPLDDLLRIYSPAVFATPQATRYCQRVEMIEDDEDAEDACLMPAGKIVSVDESSIEIDLEAEKKQWVDALTTLVMGYIARFNEAPPMHLIEQEIMGKMTVSTGRISEIVVNGDMKIFLPGFNELELRMTPLTRTIYILFLMHPEGIRLKDISDHRHALAEIYSMVKNIGDEDQAYASIADLTDPTKDSLQQKLSMSRRAIKRHILDNWMADHYMIKGQRGGLYSINLPPTMIHLPKALRQG